MSKLERDVRNQFKQYERFISQEEHEELVQCFLKDLEYQEMIEKLIAIKECGFETLEDFERHAF